jgi:hypothetical protein
MSKDIIIPGKDRGPRPVDVNDPTRGVIQEVFNNQMLTSAVNELAQRTEQLAQGLLAGMQQHASMAMEVGDLLEHLAVLVLGDEREDDERVDEATETLRSFVEARKDLRSEIEAASMAQEAVAKGETPDLYVVPKEET